jgi:hypothetical protein
METDGPSACPCKLHTLLFIILFLGRKNRPPLPTVDEKQPHTITDSECLTVLTVYSTFACSARSHHHRAQGHQPEGGHHITCAQSLSVHDLYFFAKNMRFFFISSVRRGFLAALLDRIFNTLFSLSCTNLAYCLSKPFTCWISSLAVLDGNFSTYCFSLSSSAWIVALG